MRSFFIQHWFSICLLIVALIRLSYICEKDILDFYYQGFDCESFHSEEFYLTQFAQSDNFKEFRRNLSFKVRKLLPSENSALVLGIVLGINELYYLPDFRQLLITTGTIHVVVASGFNVSLVVSVLHRFSVRTYSAGYLVTSVICTFLYAILTGFDPPIFRAWLMSILTIVFSNLGRVKSGTSVLFFTAIFMLALNPLYIYDLSFQLSFLATFGIIYYSNFFEVILRSRIQNFLADDFSTTISAQIFVLPLLLKVIGKISLLGFIANPLTLWIIPLTTVFGFVFIISILISDVLGNILALPMFYLTETFIYMLGLVNSLGDFELSFEYSNLIFLFWYILALSVPKFVFLHNKRLSK